MADEEDTTPQDCDARPPRTTQKGHVARTLSRPTEADGDSLVQTVDNAVSLYYNHGAVGILSYIAFRNASDPTKNLGRTLTERYGRAILAWMKKHPTLSKIIGILGLCCYFGPKVYKTALVLCREILSRVLPRVKIHAIDKRLHKRVVGYINKRALPTFRTISIAESAESARTLNNTKVANADDVLFHYSSTVEIIRSGWRFFAVTKQHDNDSRPGDLTIWSFGLTSNPLKRLVQEASLAEKDAELVKQGPGTRLLRPVKISRAIWNHTNFYWDCQGSTYPRSMDSVVMPAKAKAALVNDIELYLDERTAMRCASLGQPYRRNYLMHGPPGTGKTSIAMAIASTNHLTVYVLSLLEPNLTDQRLMTLMKGVQKGTLVLLEDIDSAGIGRQLDLSDQNRIDFPKVGSTSGEIQKSTQGSCVKGTDAEKKKPSGVTMTGLLNAIDGIESPTGHILIMTTNHKERLDAAIKRRGRADLDFYFGFATREQSSALFTRVYTPDLDGPEIDLTYNPKDVPTMAEKFANTIPDQQIPPAAIIGYLLRHDYRPQLALQNAKEWVREELAYMNNTEEQNPKKNGSARYAFTKMDDPGNQDNVEDETDDYGDDYDQGFDAQAYYQDDDYGRGSSRPFCSRGRVRRGGGGSKHEWGD